MRGTIAFALMLLLGAGAARAGEAAPVETRWYGWQIMLADAAGITLVAEGVNHDSLPLAVSGVITLAAVPALLHLVHNAPGDAGISFLIRTVPFGTGVALFFMLHPPCEDGCSELAFPVVGLLLSGAGAIADWIWLSTERLEPWISVAPIVPLDRRRGAGAALTMRF
jgi:hypothetical protein